MKEVAVVCAHNPGKRNSGMYSVDLAAASYFGARGVPFDLVKFIGHARVGALRYRKLRGLEDLGDYRCIVYWGDFQQNPIWGRRNFGPRYARERGLSADEAERAWRRLCLWEDAEMQRGQRVYSVGTCFLGATGGLPEALGVARYAELLGRFSAIVPRDVESLSLLRRGLGLTNVLDQGYDCAALRGPRASIPDGDSVFFSYSFARTLARESEWAPITAHLQAATGLRAVPLNWLRSKYARYGWTGMDAHYKKCMDQVQRSRFVLTDIYHLSVNAIGAGVPAVCLGRSDGEFRDTCDDGKKQILFDMLGLTGSYCRVDPGTVDPRSVEGAVARTLAHPVSELLKPADELNARYRGRIDGLMWGKTSSGAGG